MSKKRANANFEYDVCLSFAGEDRAYVSEVADILRDRGARVFYDRYETATLWGKDLYEHLDYVYQRAARFCVVFISESYAKKLWTNHERKSAQSRAFAEGDEYVLPARFDDTEIPGLRRTVGYVDLRGLSPAECAALIAQKVAPYKLLEFHNRDNYFPPEPDILFKELRARSKRKQDWVRICARSFYKSLQRMSEDERRLIATIFYSSCPHDKPDNAHLELGLLRRIIGWDEQRVLETLADLRPIGFDVQISKMGPRKEPGKLITIRWGFWSEEMDRFVQYRSVPYFTDVAWAMFDVVGKNYCDVHAPEMIVRLNFSALSTITAVDDIH